MVIHRVHVKYLTKRKGTIMSSLNIAVQQADDGGGIAIIGCANVCILGNSPEVNVGKLGGRANRSEMWEKLSAIAKFVASLFTIFNGIVC